MVRESAEQNFNASPLENKKLAPHGQETKNAAPTKNFIKEEYQSDSNKSSSSNDSSDSDT